MKSKSTDKKVAFSFLSSSSKLDKLNDKKEAKRVSERVGGSKNSMDAFLNFYYLPD
ncbi:hypothetical protein [Pleionea sediminis]|uniref:hypothetical protein n=1 Tax=Pleionea sediminis TaxID=2569479 RepID=UPI0013DDE88E|nr:hypothetical protein [Pleionea sediminis]